MLADADTLPIIMGGDCNAPGGDAALRVLRPVLRDAFFDDGRGWGNTHSSELPILRIDQIWVSKQFQVAAIVARRTLNSDHRIVICDLMLSPGK